MGKKTYYLTVDSETTQTEKVADFAAVVSDRKGRIYAQCAVLVNGIFTDMEAHPLFFDPYAPADSIWSKASRDRRYAAYNQKVKEGSRMIANVAAINRWLAKAIGQFDPVLTAYNLPFDADKCEKTGIDLTGFSRRFCLWRVAAAKYGKRKDFRQFILDNHAFNAPTKLGNMSYKTNAEIMARYIMGEPELPNEPHTALEDIIGYELPILNRIVSIHSMREIAELEIAYNWRDFQVKDWFAVK